MADVVEKRSATKRVPSPVARRIGVYSRRFVLVQLLVMLVFACTVVLFAYLISRSDSGPAWSSFEPRGSETYERAQTLANYVAPRYVSNGVPIAVVQAQPLVYRDAEVDGIAFMRRPFQGVGSPFTQFEPADNILLYVFCGPAAGCSLPVGSEDVTPLLREESLELALYTFKYWPDISSVVTLMPPSKTRRPAFLFRRRKLEKELSKPLDTTLPKHDLVSTDAITESEAATVQRLTAGSIFLSSFSQTANGHTLLLLGTGSQ